MRPSEIFHGWPGRAPSGRISYVNGRYVPHGDAGVHIEDRGLQFGDFVYEVFAILKGRIHDEEEHLDRLERSVREIRMGMPMGRAALRVAMCETVRRNRVRDGFLYLQVSRGMFKRDHPIPKDQRRPTLVMTARPFDAEAAARRQAGGIAVVTRPDIRWGRRDIKTTQLLANLLAKTEAREAGGYEAWLVDADGYVTEGASTNAWIVDRDGRLLTRGLSHAILPGVTRRVIMEAAAEAQLPVIERQFTPDDAKSAREAFISSASGAAVPVVSIDGVKIGDGKPGAFTRRIGGFTPISQHCARLRRIVRDDPFRERSIGPYAQAQLLRGVRGAVQEPKWGPPMSEKQQNLQDTFLNAVRKSKSSVTIFLVNGVKLQGNITWFDNFCVLLRRDGQAQLVYKHAISTVMPMGPVQLMDAETVAETA